jgi:hypothetical protein
VHEDNLHVLVGLDRVHAIHLLVQLLKQLDRHLLVKLHDVDPAI